MKWTRFFQNKILTFFGLLILFILLGIFGYGQIEGYNLTESLYMTVITLSTVGYGEIRPLSESGRIFTIFLILSSIGVLAYAASLFAEELMSGGLLKKYKVKKVQNRIAQLEDHVIVCGFGRNGRQAIRKLQVYQTPHLVIEKQIKTNTNYQGLANTIFIEGDATNDLTLEKAKIAKARALITALPSDADNLFVVLSARQLNPNLRIISRASDSQSIQKLKIAGADNVIMPDKIGGEHMASLIVTPDLIEFLDTISLNSSQHVNMIEVKASDLPQEYHQKTIQQLNMRAQTGCTVIGLKDEKGNFQISPEYHTILPQETELIILGKPKQIERLKKVYRLH